VFKVAVFHFDTSMLRHCLTAVSITRWASSSHAHNALTQVDATRHRLSFDAGRPFLASQPDCVVHWTQVRTVWWLQCGRNEV